MSATARVQKQSMKFSTDVHQDYVTRSTHQATRAVNHLLRDGFVIEQVELGAGGQPKIRISWHPRVANLGIPRTYNQGENGGHYTSSCVDFEQCQVSSVRNTRRLPQRSPGSSGAGSPDQANRPGKG